VTVQYLESLDSVRTGPGSGVADRDARLAELQTFLEVLMALALGRDVVVPQSYAFDSGAFLRVAHRVLSARPKASEDRPFRPHLYGPGIETFDDAVRDMLTRVHDEHRPFHSSLYPALQDMTAPEVAKVVADLDDKLVAVTGNAFAYPLLTVLREFRVTERFPVPGNGTGLSLSAAVSALVDPRSTLSSLAQGLLGTQREVYERLRSAVARLDEDAPGAFGQRSRLRQNVPWPNRPDGCTAAQIAGEDLPLVVEFIDTVYNRVVADSMGRPTALYSTTATADDTQLEARYLAQELALGRPPLLDANGEDSEVPPYFHVGARTSGAKRDKLLVDDLAKLFEAGAEALEPLMAARSRPSSTFWRGVTQLDEATGAGNRAAYERARDKHLAHVATLLVGQVDLSWAADAGISLAVHAAKEPIAMNDPTGTPSIVLDAAFYLTSRAAKRTTSALATRRARGRLASAIGSIVPAGPRQRRP
jgi:hypothetical protein